jgi:hypothetical protein
VLLALAVAPLAADKPLLGERPQWHTTDPDRADAVQRIILATPLLAAAAAALAARRVPAWVRGLLPAAAPFAIGYWILAAWPTPPVGWRTLAVAAGASLVLWAILEPLAVRRPTGVAVPWVCGCVAGGVALLNLFSTVTGSGWIAVAVGGVIAGAFVVALTGRGPSFAGGPVVVIVPLLVCAVLAHVIGGGQVPLWQWSVLAAAPALAWVAELRPMCRWRPWLREPLRMALVAVPVVIAVVPAHRQWVDRQQEEMGGDELSLAVPAWVDLGSRATRFPDSKLAPLSRARAGTGRG